MQLCQGNNNKKELHIRSLLRDRPWLGYFKWKDFKGIHVLSLLAKWPISLVAFHQNHFVCAQHTELCHRTWAKGKTTWPSVISLAIAKHHTGFGIMTEIPKHHQASRYPCIFYKNITRGMFSTGFFLWQFQGHFSTYVPLRSKAWAIFVIWTIKHPILWHSEWWWEGKTRKFWVKKAFHYVGNELYMHLWVFCWEC